MADIDIQSGAFRRLTQIPEDAWESIEECISITGNGYIDLMSSRLKKSDVEELGMAMEELRICLGTALGMEGEEIS